ncbi:guanylin [Amia ocellicauda]|uniref:guanylin n=1 Tax=Amia ocellicauda TaxID=2972642 RepID=UPI003463C5C2
MSWRRAETSTETALLKYTSRTNKVTRKTNRSVIMKCVLATVFCLVALCVFSDAVQVKEGDFTFSLEAVKKLKEVMDASAVKNPRLAKTSLPASCSDPDLPAEFLPLCQSSRPGMSFYRLALLAEEPDVCEICAFAACTGC